MWWTIIPILLLPMASQGRMDCSRAEHERCTRIADPLIKEPDLVFPDTMRDIERVCEIWNQLVDCLQAYTNECFTTEQRKQFNRAVESPIESVHQLCRSHDYQRKYLEHAPCIKNTITERRHCGQQYNLLVDQGGQGDVISKSTLCCSHDRFKQCVIRETRRLCDTRNADGPASRFAAQTIDKAMSFLQDQCYNYIPNSGDCTTSSDFLPHSDRSNDPLTISTSPSEVYPWSTIQQEVQRERLPSRVTPPRISTTSTWLPASNSPSANSPSTDFFSTQMLGSRSRPSTWGRSGGWSESPQVAGNTVQLYPDLPSTPSSTQLPPRADWAVTQTAWGVRAQPGARPSETNRPSSSSYPFQTSPGDIQFEITSTAWYPAAGNQLSNEIDEPNQLGLKKLRNMSSIATAAVHVIVLSLTVLRIFV